MMRDYFNLCNIDISIEIDIFSNMVKFFVFQSFIY